MGQAFRAKGLVPDFEGPFEYTHRRDGETDIYFVAGTGKAECTFRVKGKQPELWCPVGGKTKKADGWRSMPGGRTSLTSPTKVSKRDGSIKKVKVKGETSFIIEELMNQGIAKGDITMSDGTGTDNMTCIII